MKISFLALLALPLTLAFAHDAQARSLECGPMFGEVNLYLDNSGQPTKLAKLTLGYSTADLQCGPLANNQVDCSTSYRTNEDNGVIRTYRVIFKFEGNSVRATKFRSETPNKHGFNMVEEFNDCREVAR